MAADMIMAADMREAAALKKAQDSYSKKSKTAGSMWHQKKLRERKAAQIGEINMAAVRQGLNSCKPRAQQQWPRTNSSLLNPKQTTTRH